MTGWIDDGSTSWQGRPVARSVSETDLRCRAVLAGVVRSVAAHAQRHVRGPARASVRGPAFDAWLDDGTGLILLRWTRVAVPGIAPGVGLQVEGTVGILSGAPGVLNPLYRFAQAGSSTS